MAAKDIKLDSNGDLAIENGDFVITESDAQHIKDLMQSAPGWFKKFPLVGLNPSQYINSRNTQILSKNVRIQLETDGYKIVDLDISIDQNGALSGTINAKRI